MSRDTIAEQVSEMIWMDRDNRASMKGFVYNNGTIDPGLTLTEFMREAHEIALQLLSEFPAIDLVGPDAYGSGEYLDEQEYGPDNELIDQDFNATDQLLIAMARTNWTSVYHRLPKPESRTDGHVIPAIPGAYVLNREYAPRVNDLIVARDFPNPYAMLFFLADEARHNLAEERRRRSAD